MKLARLLITLDEELLSALTINLQELWVEVRTVGGSWLVTPSCDVRVVEGSLHRLRVLLCVHLEFFREWRLNSSLQFFDLMLVDTFHIVAKDLPLLDLAFVEMHFLLLYLLCANYFFDPPL